MSRRKRHNQGSPASFFAFQDVITSVTGILLLITLLATLELVTRKLDAADRRAAATPVDNQKEIEQKQQQLEALQRQLAEIEALLEQLASGKVVTQADLDALERRAEELEVKKQKLSVEADRLRRALEAIKKQLATAEKRKTELAEKLKATAEGRDPSKGAKVTVLGGRATGKRALLLEVEPGRLTIAELDEDQNAKLIKRFGGGDRLVKFGGWLNEQDASAIYFVLLVRSKGVEAFMPLRRMLAKTGFDAGWDIWPEGKYLFEE